MVGDIYLSTNKNAPPSHLLELQVVSPYPAPILIRHTRCHFKDSRDVLPPMT